MFYFPIFVVFRRPCSSSPPQSTILSKSMELGSVSTTCVPRALFRVLCHFDSSAFVEEAPADFNFAFPH